MSFARLDSRDWKLFVVLALMLNSPPLLLYVPIVGILAFIPALFWISIPGIPLALLGLPFFEIKELGAIPKGPVAWGLVVMFWLAAAFGSTLLLKKRRNRKR